MCLKGMHDIALAGIILNPVISVYSRNYLES